MKYNLYTLILSDSNIKKVNAIDLEQDIKIKLKKIETEIIQEYLKKQEARTGIRTLGNEIKGNKIIHSQFSEENNNLLIKMTENRRSFINVFLDNIISNYNHNLYFLILEKNFGNTSRLVDRSFPDINFIRNTLNKFFDNFNTKNKINNIFFIELKGFNDYFCEEIADLGSKIHKKNN